MKEWPLNSAMLTTTTHNKLREALDETDTQVATCAIDRWTVKMKRTEGYITKEIPRRERTAIRKTPGSSIGGVSEEEKKKSSSAEDELWPSPQPRCRRTSSPTIPPDHWRRPHKGPILKPASLPNSLYWAYWIWVYSHLQWKEPPKSGPYSNLWSEVAVLSQSSLWHGTNELYSSIGISSPCSAR